MHILDLLQIDLPIIQAPMAGVSTPDMAAAASNAGALGSIGVGAATPEEARQMIVAFRTRSPRALNVNVFCHKPAEANKALEDAWVGALAPHFEKFGASPPVALREIYTTFIDDDAMLNLLLREKPTVVSFHFGLPPTERVRALREAGIVLLASATSVQEGLMAQAVGAHAVIAQGCEAGGHRGVFDPQADDDGLGTVVLTRLLARDLVVPVIAAGAIMDGAGVSAVMQLGAAAAQLGTAFVGCPESAADSGYREALFSDAAMHTVMTRAISGRPARCLRNHFTAFGRSAFPRAIPSYPIAYDAGKALNSAAKAVHEFGYGAHWAGQGAPFARRLPVGELIARLADELRSANDKDQSKPRKMSSDGYTNAN